MLQVKKARALIYVIVTAVKSLYHLHNEYIRLQRTDKITELTAADIQFTGTYDEKIKIVKI